MKKFLIIGFILLLILSMFTFAQDDVDTAVEDVLLDEVKALDLEPLPDEDITVVPKANVRIEIEEDLLRVNLDLEPPVDFSLDTEEDIVIPTAMVAGAATGFVILYLVMVLILMGLMIGACVFWIWMLVDCAKHKFKTENDKVVWILIIVLAGLVGAIVYYFVIKRKAKKRRR